MNPIPFLPKDQKLETFSDILPYFQRLLETEITSSENLKQWLLQRSELESFISEDLAWRYINMTRHTANKSLEQHYLFFINDIQPYLSSWQDKVNRKMINAESYCTNDSALSLYFKRVKTELKLYCENNIQLQVNIQTASQKYAVINGAMFINYLGKDYTMQQAAVFLKSKNREERKQVYELMQERRYKESQPLDELYAELVKTRHQIALNAGFENFRDYTFEALNRFDYSKNDCYQFHESIAKHIVPLAKELQIKRKKALMVDKLRPYDLEVDLYGSDALRPFIDCKDLLTKTVACLSAIDPFFAQCLSKMDTMGHLDLDSRKDKAPGGYNYPLLRTGFPFIFMNASGLLRDIETLIHEAGHAVHSVLTKDLPLAAYKETPAEVAELASMSMELISRKGWNHFFSKKEDEERALNQQLEDIIMTLPWIATIDRFQHKVYENPHASITDRETFWNETQQMFSTGMVDFTGYEYIFSKGWQKQLHLFELPFYYIEYGFAQLGAIAIWKNYLSKKQTTLDQYKNALRLGQTKSIPEVYEAAGIAFDFSERNILDLSLFIKRNLEEKH
jgi:oligoendopeptidase F